MARVFGTDYFEERCEGEWAKEFYDWYKPVARRLYLENMSRFAEDLSLDRADPLYLRGAPTDEYPWGRGIAYPQPPKPLRGRIIRLPGNRLTDFISGLGVVSDRVKAKIEEIEPGVHQFLPVELEMPDGAIVQESYWRFCNMNVLDTLVLEKSEFMQPYYFNKDKCPNFLEYECNSNGPPVLALNKGLIEGRAIWLDYKLTRLFFSDALVDWLDAVGITGWEVGEDVVQPTTIIEV